MPPAGADPATNLKYSFVVPVHNEEENLRPLMGEIEAARQKLDGPSEVIFVNDASTDGGALALEELAGRYSGLVLIEFAQNAGQSAALAAGIRNATGKWIITLDADLQNDPNDLPEMAKYTGEFEVVIGRRARRRDSLVKKITSRIANKIRNWLTYESISDTGCSLRIIDAAILKRVPEFNGMHRFIPTLCRMEGAKVKEVDVNHRHRRHGTTHYGTMNRAFRALADALAVRWLIKRRLRYTISKIRR